MYIVTGGAGFIGSAFVWKLNSIGIEDILIVDHLDTSDKWKNLVGKSFIDYFHRDKFLEIISNDESFFQIDAIIHMGACSSTTEKNADYLIENNYRYTKTLAEWAIKNEVRFIYASSGATYGDGLKGYSDDNDTTQVLRPLNMYGYSKHIFDLWALRTRAINKIVGLKFFNVFGANEYHKGDMSSVIYKAFNQIIETGKIKLFKSYRKEYKDGEQKRDFVYIKDCVDVIWNLLERKDVYGIFNLGTGIARTWNDLASAVFSSMGYRPTIEYIEMPETIRDRYQYFTQANMQKIQSVCPVQFHSLEDAIRDYIVNYLQKPDPYL